MSVCWFPGGEVYFIGMCDYPNPSYARKRAHASAQCKEAQCALTMRHMPGPSCVLKEAGAHSYTPASSRGPVYVESVDDLVSSDSLA